MTQKRLNRQHRQIIKRIIVRGTLLLDTPTCLSNGDSDDSIDLMLVRDGLEDKALLTASSIAGALRNYVREYGGYESADESRLFGCQRSDVDGDQSPLIIYDALSSDNLKAELRDGVKINSITGTAEKGAKYDLELLEAGTQFDLCFELAIDKQDKNENVLIKELAIALSGLKQGEISLGMKKRRGFGHCHVKEWQVWNFNLEDSGDRMAWLTLDHSWLTDPPCTKLPAVNASIIEAMKKAVLQVAEHWEDKRDRFTIHATFKLVGSLLIRSGQAETGRAPDVVHLKSHRPKKESENEPDPNQQNLVPILSGTSLAGVLRHRAERIVKTLQCSFGQNPECDKEPEIIKSIFGQVENKRSQASRLIVHESTINHTTDLVQTRIAIDRFTGGAYHGALFDEQPIFGNDETCVTIELELRQPKEYEIGLILLLIKDLWTSDLPVGGESSIGRGRLKGIKADLIRHHPKEPKGWTIAEANESLQVMNLAELKQSEDLVKDELERFIKDLLKELGKEVEA